MNAFPRYNIYEIIHKALRTRLSQTLTAVGQVDVDHAPSLNAVCDQVQTLLTLMRSHLMSENEFVHPAMEERAPGSTATIADEHVHHEADIALLGRANDDLRSAPLPDRQAHADRLYVLLDRFVQENLVHMRYEEDKHNAVLWAAYSDEEIHAIERRLVAAIPPEKMMLALASMIPSIPTRDRALLLGGIRASAPPEVFDRICAGVLPLLGDDARLRLAARLGLQAQTEETVAA